MTLANLSMVEWVTAGAQMAKPGLESIQHGVDEAMITFTPFSGNRASNDRQCRNICNEQQ